MESTGGWVPDHFLYLSKIENQTATVNFLSRFYTVTFYVNNQAELHEFH